MSFFVDDFTLFKRDFHALLDSCDALKLTPNQFREEALVLALTHRVSLDVDTFVSQLTKLYAADNVYRAHKLVDVLDDKALSLRGARLIRFGWCFMGLAALTVWIALTVWLVT